MNSKSSPKGSGALRRDRLEDDPAVIFALDNDLRIVYCNAAWDRFARENSGAGLERHRQLGQPVMACVPDVLKPFFEDGYRRVLTSREAWQHSYECSSPSHFRSFRMLTYAEPDGSGLVVVNSLTVMRPHDEHDRVPLPPEISCYLDEAGVLKMCSHCRRVCHRADHSRWDWVPELLAAPPKRVSHGICGICRQVFYPDSVEGPTPLLTP
ncbi:PAS domain-containing protein [Paludibaculum fermentans]|uniref:PAS domain-containing protein n=1 Tax=Paludibaculum fermentans TaxID=1473598 RepID=UPI003EBE78D5